MYRLIVFTVVVLLLLSFGCSGSNVISDARDGAGVSSDQLNPGVDQLIPHPDQMLNDFESTPDLKVPGDTTPTNDATPTNDTTLTNDTTPAKDTNPPPCPDQDGDKVCDVDDLCPNLDDTIGCDQCGDGTCHKTLENCFNCPEDCSPVYPWPAEWTKKEDDVLNIVNANRAKGWDCKTEGVKPKTHSLQSFEKLRWAARCHSADMAHRKYTSHKNPDGLGPPDRIKLTGYAWKKIWAENIAWSSSTPSGVMSGWMSSDGHCGNIMNGIITDIGVGYYYLKGSPKGHYWTQVFTAH